MNSTHSTQKVVLVGPLVIKDDYWIGGAHLALHGACKPSQLYDHVV